ncbi:hypothetical protein CPB84DRAFT_1520528 [Gymnopilus junonius]|uniref:Uncharacterized protein n=1 Tax=Gymnopilus junonius TaxID=109634 RepID=A0A9P5TK51_GYMJU|nr:hypothetical protein CPB84DRAFT_1520528 [Gymnopilus junonius]
MSDEFTKYLSLDWASPTFRLHLNLQIQPAFVIHILLCAFTVPNLLTSVHLIILRFFLTMHSILFLAFPFPFPLLRVSSYFRITSNHLLRTI